MEKITPKTPDITQENIERILELFPSVATEVADSEGETRQTVDFDALRELLGDVAEGNRERYQFTWPGKREAKLLARKPCTKTLRPEKAKSVNWDTTENLYIEGDNLEALKIMRETYAGKIKLIYIDPPYNTGHDFIYNDHFAQTKTDYDGISGDYDEEGGRLVANPESNGRYHSDWCSMMYPRLLLARDLLTDDGVIFISIDDNEQENLKKICDEVFGAEYFMGLFPWRKRTAKSDVPFGVSQDYEWILAYAHSEKVRISTEGGRRKYHETPDFPGRPWRYHDLTTQRTASERPNSFFTIVHPETGEEFPCDPNRTWRVTKDTFLKYVADDRIVFPGDYDFLNIKKPVLRYWQSDDMAKDGENFGRIPVSTKLPDDAGMSLNGTREILELFDTKLFNFSKPVNLIEYLLKWSTSVDKDALILDFFSGSATTAHAVMQLNAEDGGNRKFIMVQLPEVTDEKSEARKAGFGTICDIGQERIRRAGAKICAEIEESNKQLKLGEEPKKLPDVGFRVLRIDSSNFKDTHAEPGDTRQENLFDLVDNLEVGRSEEDLLFQTLPAFRIPYSAHIEETDIDGTRCFNVNNGQLIACFDEQVSTSVIEKIAQQKPLYAVFRDASLADDSAAANFEELFRTFSPETIRRVI